MIDVGFFSALLGGFLTFLAPCTLPLIPAYVGFISGSSVTGRVGEENAARRKMMFSALSFVLGFSSVFILFYGVTAGAISEFLVVNRMLLSQIGGVVIIFFGLLLLNLIKLPKLLSGAMPKIPSWVSPGSYWGALLLGVLFAVGWSPCLGPILGTIIIIASTKGTISYGIYLLSVYSLGLAIPFLVVAYLYGSSFVYVHSLSKHLVLIQKIGAVVLIVIGALFVVGQFGIMNTLAMESFGHWYLSLMQYM